MSITSATARESRPAHPAPELFEQLDDLPDSFMTPRIKPDMSGLWERLQTGGLIGAAVLAPTAVAVGATVSKAGGVLLGVGATLSASAALYGAVQLERAD